MFAVNAENKVERINVTLSTQFENYYVVTDGLTLGTKVITSNVQKIRPGASVQIATTETVKTDASASDKK